METKKLTAKDLMIGDWVTTQCLIPNKKVAVRIIRLDEADELCKYEPIPLTAEILEKFGFVKHRDIFYRFAVHIDEFNGFMLTLGSDFDGVFCLQSNRFVRFSYVHELQHALRLCGVDKEIVL